MIALLVWGECDCGWRCACPIGAIWPKCPDCGEQVMPPIPGGPVPRYGVAGELEDEQDAYAKCDTERHPQVYAPEQIRVDRDQRGALERDHPAR